MTQEKLDRINELAHFAKERELTADEQEERAALRKEYIEDWRRGTIELLENTYIVTPDGKKHKLPKRARRPRRKRQNRTRCDNICHAGFCSR